MMDFIIIVAIVIGCIIFIRNLAHNLCDKYNFKLYTSSDYHDLIIADIQICHAFVVVDFEHRRYTMAMLKMWSICPISIIILSTWFFLAISWRKMSGI